MSRKVAKLLSLFIAVCMIFGIALVGCGGSKDGAKESSTQAATTAGTTAAPTTEAPKDPVTINVTSWRAEDEAVYKQMIEKFESENPDVKINLELQKDGTVYQQTVKANLLSGEELDVFDLQPSMEFAQYAREGQLLDLSDMEFIANYSDSAKELTTVDGKVYGFNAYMNLLLCIYNKDTFKKYNLDVPKDFTDFVNIVNTLKKNGEGGLSYCGADLKGIWIGDAVMLSEMGAAAFKKMEEDIDQGNITNLKDIPEAYAGLKTLSEMHKNKLLYDKAESIGFAQSVTLFAQKKAPMLFMGTWTFGTAENDYPGIDFGIFALPSLNKPTIANGVPGIVSCIYAKTEKADAAKKWLNYFASPETASTLCNSVKMLSTVKGVNATFKGADLLAEQMNKGIAVKGISNVKNNSIWLQPMWNMYENILLKGADVDKEIAAFEAVLKKADLKNKK